MYRINQKTLHKQKHQDQFLKDNIKEIYLNFQNKQFENVVELSSDLLTHYNLDTEYKLSILSYKALSSLQLGLQEQAIEDHINFINICEIENDRIRLNKKLLSFFDNACIIIAQYYITKGNLVNGEKFLLKTSEQGCDNINYQKLLYFLYMEHAKYKDALNILDNILQYKEFYNDPVNHFNKGSNHFHLGDYDNAKISFNKSLELKPDFTQAKLLLIQIDIVTYNFNSVEQELQDLLEISLGSVEISF